MGSELVFPVVSLGRFIVSLKGAAEIGHRQPQATAQLRYFAAAKNHQHQNENDDKFPRAYTAHKIAFPRLQKRFVPLIPLILRDWRSIVNF